MESSRRKFIRQLLAGSASMILAAPAWANDVHTEPLLSVGSPGMEPDWGAIRSQFQFHPNQIYLNNGTIGVMPQAVMDGMDRAMKRLQKGEYATPSAVREAVARLVKAPADSIALTHNTTQGINIIAQGLRLRRGDELILTDQEHAGNAVPWLQRARIDGLKVRVLSLGPDAASTLMALERLVTKRTKVIALPHITCTNGQVLPAATIVKRYQDRVPHIFFDGAHGAGTTALDLPALNCGYYATCGHKWLCGPAGTGFLYIRPDLLEQLTPRFTGAGSDSGWSLDTHEQRIHGWAPGAQRFEVGTQNRVLAEGLQAAIEFWEGIGWEAVHSRIRFLQQYLRKRIATIPGIEILTPEESTSASSMLTFRAVDLSRRNALMEYLRTFNRYRIRWVLESDLLAIRTSTHAYNSLEELDELADAVEAWRE